MNERDLILLRDNYLNCFDRPNLLSAATVLRHLGFRVYLSEVIHNGKLLHVKGMRGAFKSQARQIMNLLATYKSTGATLVGMETMTRLLPANEYAEVLGQAPNIDILGIENVLLQALTSRTLKLRGEFPSSVTLLPHCLEQTASRETEAQWQAVFRQLGISLNTKHLGCCGMSGLFGHEINNNRLSENIFKLAWQPFVKQYSGTILATGFSCRCQLRNHNVQVMHPIMLLHQILLGPVSDSSTG